MKHSTGYIIDNTNERVHVGVDELKTRYPGASFSGGIRMSGAGIGIGRGAVVSNNVTIDAHVEVGEYTIIQDGVWLQPNAVVCHNVTVNAGANIGEGSLIGYKSLVGKRAIIGPGCRIERHVTIADDLVVPPNTNVKEGTILNTIPALTRMRASFSGLVARVTRSVKYRRIR